MYADRDEHLGLALPAVGGAISAIGGLFKGGSPRYNGNGPLMSTVRGFMARVASGDLGVISDLDRERRTNKDSNHKRAWQMVWDVEVPKQPLTAAQINLIGTLDPSKRNIMSKAPSSAYPPSQPKLPISIPGIPPVVAGLSTTPLLIAGAAAVALVYLSGGNRRRR